MYTDINDERMQRILNKIVKDKQVIINKDTTIVTLNNEFKGWSIKGKNDINLPEIGENIAFLRALEKLLIADTKQFIAESIEKEINKGDKMQNELENFKIVKGDLLKDFKGDVIAHQVNCKGIMGGGIALQLRQKYPMMYDAYKKLCDEKLMLGLLHIYYPQGDEPTIANLFGQFGFGKNGIHTDYSALNTSLIELKEYMIADNCTSVGFPYMIGCGLAGGDVDTVMTLIKNVFKDSGITVTFYDINK